MSDYLSREDVMKIIKQHVVETIDGVTLEMIDETRPVTELGASSLDIVEIVSCSMRELKVKVPRGELMLIESLGELADLLHKYVEEKSRLL